MKEGFRQSMAWLHTWTGLVVGWILFFVFIMGTAGYVNSELTRWMQPEKPLINANIPSNSEQFKLAGRWIHQNIDASQIQNYSIQFLTQGRESSDLGISWRELPSDKPLREQFHREKLNPYTGELIKTDSVRETGGGDALYRMHYVLHYMPYLWGIYIVGICTMFMLVAIITGIITHKKIFKDFFTFRPAKGQRSWLDAHNVLSVIALPFFIIVTYSSLMHYADNYMPLGVPFSYGFAQEDQKKYLDDFYQRGNSDQGQQSIDSISSQLIDMQKLVEEKEKLWGKNNVQAVYLDAPNDKEPARINIRRVIYDKVSRNSIAETSIAINAITGQMIEAKTEPTPKEVFRIMFALHEGRFADGLIRWAYVITGLIGSGMIATGLVLWTVKRRVKATKAGKTGLGHQLVEKLNIATVAGLPFAVAIYFWANRLIPSGLDQRANWEINSLFIAWLFTFIYAVCRPFMKAWREILTLAALAWLLLPVLNFFTTDRHLGMTIAYGDWVLVNVEIGFILIGLILAWTAWKVQKRIHQPIPVKPSRKASTKKVSDNETV